MSCKFSFNFGVIFIKKVFDFQYEKIIFNCQPSHFSPYLTVDLDGTNFSQEQVSFAKMIPNTSTLHIIRKLLPFTFPETKNSYILVMRRLE